MNIQIIWAVYFFGVGACVGSFLNVVIYRLPKKESLIRPGSHCPACNSPIKWYHNIPIAGYLALGGKCADCGEKFSPRYAAVEAITGLLFAACYAAFGLTATAAVYMVFVSALVAVVFIDIDHFIIPDAITLPGIPIGLLCAWLFLPLSISDALIGVLVGGGILFVIAVIAPQGMGGGDIKLLGMVGAFLGWKSALITIFLGSLVGSVGGIIGMIALGKGRKAKIPFGPYLAVGALLAMFFEREIIDFYIRIAMP
ncbi:MAG: prepilin peptidase [Nitrospinota bacterium]